MNKHHAIAASRALRVATAPPPTNTTGASMSFRQTGRNSTLLYLKFADAAHVGL